MVEAKCTWGMGPDVLVVMKETVLLMESPVDLDKWTHGTCKHSQLDLTAKEARAFAAELLNAADVADGLNKQCEDDYDRWLAKQTGDSNE